MAVGRTQLEQESARPDGTKHDQAMAVGLGGPAALSSLHSISIPNIIMDTSPTSLFEAYEQDFQQLIASIRDKIEDHASDEGGGKYFRHNR